MILDISAVACHPERMLSSDYQPPDDPVCIDKARISMTLDIEPGKREAAPVSADSVAQESSTHNEDKYGACADLTSTGQAEYRARIPSAREVIKADQKVDNVSFPTM